MNCTSEGLNLSRRICTVGRMLVNRHKNPTMELVCIFIDVGDEGLDLVNSFYTRFISQFEFYNSSKRRCCMYDIEYSAGPFCSRI